MYKSLLVLLDLSAALDTIDHRTLLNILESDYGIGGDAIKWFESYLSVRKQQIFINQQLSKPFDLDCEVPQGNCLEPILFLLAASRLLKVLAKYHPEAHAYADDSQLYFSFKPDSSNSQREAF